MLDDKDEFEHREVVILKEADSFVRSVLFMLVPSILVWVGIWMLVVKLLSL